MLIRFNVPHVFYPGSDKTENALVLRALVDNLVRLNLIYLACEKRRGGTVPRLYSSGVVYDRTLWWEPIPALYARRYGDCKSLSAALIAEKKFYDNVKAIPTFRWVQNLDGSVDYHILVQVGDEFEDPSKVLGMGADENRRFYGNASS
jgi:hypothetical protein